MGSALHDARVALAETPCITHAADRLHMALAALVAEIDAAPVRSVCGHQWDDVFAKEGNVVWCSDLEPGQRVALLRVGEG